VGTERGGNLLGDARDADIPGDMPLPFMIVQPEVAECVRNQTAVVIAGEDERRRSARLPFKHGRGVVPGKQQWSDIVNGHGGIR
jgi:hypothetical protein